MHGEVPGTQVPSAASDRRFARVYQVLGEAIAARAFPGCSFGVLAGGSVQLEDALGRFTYDEDAGPVVSGTVYDIASITKVMATTAMAMLLEQRGALELETPLGEYLPGFIVGRPAAQQARHVRIHHLLAHSSGLPGYRELYKTRTNPDSLLRACLELPLEAAPGTRADYSDIGFILLGKALESAAGAPFGEWVAREILQPLGLGSTGFNPAPPRRAQIPPTEFDAALRGRRIQGEVQDEHAWILNGVAGHAGLFSNVPDLLAFAAAVLNAGPESLFERVTVERFARRQPPEGSSRALGWDTPSADSTAGRYFSPHSVGHLGYSGCSLWIDLDHRVAAVLLTNRTWPDRASQLIREVRPAFHDAVFSALSPSSA